MKKPTLFLLALSSLALAGLAAAADWPQWRGPDRTDVSKETGLLKSWKEAPKLLWTFRDMGIGYSGPSVVGDMIYSMGADGKTESIFAVDTKAQKKVWSTVIGPQWDNGWGDGPRGTPTVDGDLVFGIGGQGNLICVKAATGEKVWSRKLKADKDDKESLGGEMMSGWGYTESPLVDGDRVVCTPGGPGGTMAAFDKKTGELLWRSKDWTDKAGYSSIIIADVGGIHQYIQMTGNPDNKSPGSVAGVAAKDGKLLWKYERNGPTAAIPTPIVHDDFVFATSGYSAGCDLIHLKADGKGGVEAEKVEKKNMNMTNHHGGVVRVGENLYGYDDGKGALVCLNFKTLKPAWTQNKDMQKSCLTCADGQLYLYGENDGTVLLVEANPEKYVENGRFKIPEQTKLKRKGGHIWTHPVVANGKLYLRDQDLLFCYDIGGGSSAAP